MLWVLRRIGGSGIVVDLSVHVCMNAYVNADRHAGRGILCLVKFSSLDFKLLLC